MMEDPTGKDIPFGRGVAGRASLMVGPCSLACRRSRAGASRASRPACPKCPTRRRRRRGISSASAGTGLISRAGKNGYGRGGENDR